MIVGVPKEVKVKEHRIAIVPSGVKSLCQAGHSVLIQQGAGLGCGIKDDSFRQVGAQILASAEELWDRAEIVIKVKEPIPQEYDLIKPGQILLTFLHLAAVEELAALLCQKKVSAIGYETIELGDGTLPALIPMSEVAGRVAVQMGALCLERQHGGKGLLLGGVPGVRRGKVTIIGGGIVGTNAAKIAVGLGAKVEVLDTSQQRLRYLEDLFGSKLSTLSSNPESIERSVSEADLVIGAVLKTGSKAPRLVSKAMVASMEAGSAIVDVAIDQGGSIETIRPTTHDDPMFIEQGVIHYGVTNIPACVPQTSTYALTNVSHKYLLKIANMGFEGAIASDSALKRGVNTAYGSVVHKAVKQAIMDH